MIYWGPAGSFPADYTQVVNQYITDIGAASGRGDNVYAVNQEYSRATSPAGGDQIRYLINGGSTTPVAAIIDTTAYPAASSTSATSPGCAPAPVVGTTFTACVTNQAVRTGISRLIAAGSLATGLGSLYTVFFPPKVDVTSSEGAYGSKGFCGIHDQYQSTTVGAVGPVIFAEENYPLSSGCGGGQYPQYFTPGPLGEDAKSADLEVSILSHEINEAITDPQFLDSYGYSDIKGQEIGDECNQIFGAPLGSTDASSPSLAQQSQYNQVINGNKYWTQETFSNATFAAFKTGQGCVQKAFRPQGSASATQPQPDLGTGQVTANPLNLPANGTSTSTITMTISKQNGEPVVGDSVNFSVRPSETSTGGCGVISGGSETTADKPDPNAATSAMTNADGQASVIYTASSENATCDVIASEAQGGTASTVMIYQGTAAQQAPTITTSPIPGSITAGAPPVTFTTTTTNPGAADLDGARVTIYLSGDNKAAVGLVAGQVNLAYSDQSTGGQFVSLPLTGTTVADGVISGSTLPAQGSTLTAGSSTTTTTFQLSLAAGAPGSAATGVPLHIETDLDQINAASGSTTNLDYNRADTTAIAGTTVTPPPVVTPTTTTTTIIQPTQTIVMTVPVTTTQATKCTVPKLVGRTLASAKAALKAAKCTSVTLVEPTATKHRKKLVVARVSPKAGSHVPSGGTVTVTFKRIA